MRKKLVLISIPLVLLAFLWILIRSRPVQEWISLTAMDFIHHSLNLEVHWKSFDLRPYPPRVVLQDISIPDLGEVSNVEIRSGIFPWDLHVFVQGMRLNWKKVKAGKMRRNCPGLAF